MDIQPRGAALRKRTQIAMANRTMFLWVAGVSVIIGFALVVGIFLVQMLLFNERVLQEKAKTIATLEANNANIPKLKSQVRALDTNQALISAKANPDDETLQVILDALPSEANSVALGSSIQVLSRVSGISLNSLQTDSVVGVELLNNSSVENASSSSSDDQSEIIFRFSVSGDDIALTNVLLNIEKSIRAIDVTSLKIESQGLEHNLTIQGRAFYEPTRVVELKDKVVK